MGYAQRNIWAQLVASVAGTVVYVAIVLPQVLSEPIGDVAWQWPMVWVIVGTIAAAIALSIGWGILAGIRDPDEEHASDQRDREIEWFGDRIGQGFGVIGGVGAIVLAMVEAEWFWIGNTLFFGFFLSGLLSGISRLVAYRRGFQ
jgi:hypothetical protein